MTDPFHQAWRDCRRTWFAVQRTRLKQERMYADVLHWLRPELADQAQESYDAAITAHVAACSAFLSLWHRASPDRTLARPSDATLDMSRDAADETIEALIAARIIDDSSGLFQSGVIDSRPLLERMLSIASWPGAVDG